MRVRRFLTSIFFSIMAASLAGCANGQPDDLHSVHQDMVQRFDTVSHIEADSLQKSDPDQTVIFDTRTKAEYNVSHIKGAIHLDPDISARDFFETYETQIAGKDLVFYCSVGVRSSIMADRLIKARPAYEIGQVHNLSHGLFGWHNKKRPLVRGDVPTDDIHPYDEKWGRMVIRQDKTKYEAG